MLNILWYNIIRSVNGLREKALTKQGIDPFDKGHKTYSSYILIGMNSVLLKLRKWNWQLIPVKNSIPH